MSRSQDHEMYQQVERYNLAMEGRTNIKLGGNFHREKQNMTIFRSVGQLDRSRNIADIQHIECKNQQKTSSNRRNIIPFKETGVKEWIAGVKILSRSS